MHAAEELAEHEELQEEMTAHLEATREQLRAAREQQRLDAATISELHAARLVRQSAEDSAFAR